MTKSYTEEELLKASSMIKDGRLIAEIAEELGRSVAATYKMIENYGGRRAFNDGSCVDILKQRSEKVMRRFKDEDEKYLMDCYEKGLSVVEVATTLNRSIQSVYSVCKRMGIRLSHRKPLTLFGDKLLTIDERIELLEQQIKLIFDIIEGK